MKTLVIGAAFATLLASSAFAQSYNPEDGSANVINEPALAQNGGDVTGALGNVYAYSSAPVRARHGRGLRAQASAVNGTAVYVAGQYVGQDPDPNVRLELRRDWMHE